MGGRTITNQNISQILISSLYPLHRIMYRSKFEVNYGYNLRVGLLLLLLAACIGGLEKNQKQSGSKWWWWWLLFILLLRTYRQHVFKTWSVIRTQSSIPGCYVTHTHILTRHTRRSKAVAVVVEDATKLCKCLQSMFVWIRGILGTETYQTQE